MNTKKTIAFVLLTVALMLAGCSGTVSINTDNSFVDHDNVTYSSATQTPAETPWWANGDIDNNWPY